MAGYPHSDLTLNVIPQFCGRPTRPLAEQPNLHARRRWIDYASSMCSNDWTAAHADRAPDLAEQLAAAIEECAAAVRSQDGAAAGELAERLAAA